MKTEIITENCIELHKRYDEQSGCTFVIAINICYGDKGNGGTRMINYNTIEEGIEDAKRLANAMTKKCIVIGKEYNGGYSGAKGVIIGNPKTQKTPDMLRRFGEFVQLLNGRFQTGTDMNITLSDIEYMAEKSDYVDGLADGLGDTAIPTALGVLIVMKKMCQWKYGSDNLKGKVVAVQGTGSVGKNLIERLIDEEAIVIATDSDKEKLKKIKNEFKIETIEPDEIYSVKCDIFSPNAIGGILTDKNISKLNCSMIIGSANNQLVNGIKSVKKLKKRKVIYVPDYIINIGGVFLSMCEVQGKNIDYVNKILFKIVNLRLEQIIKKSKKENITFFEASELLINKNFEAYKKQ